jgi:hypothetical protein
MRPVVTILRLGGVEIKENDRGVSLTMIYFVNVTMYNNNMLMKI